MTILIIGDSCTDVFMYGDINRLSPEAPVPVFNPRRSVENDGMAKNVAKNVEALDTTIYTITNPNSIRKVRYVDEKSNQLVLRVDEHDHCDRIDSELLLSIQTNKVDLPMNNDAKFDAIIVSDYNKGFLTEDDIQLICESNDNVFVDTKKKLGNWISQVDYLKINSLEYNENKKFLSVNPAILERTIVTMGNRGCLFQGKMYPTDDVPVKDISGAGDTFLAGLAVEYINTTLNKSNPIVGKPLGNIVKAIKFAQKCTKIVVQKHGVSTI